MGKLGTLACLALGLGACFSGEFRDGQLSCAVNQLCPAGFACIDGVCQHEGGDGDGDGDIDAAVDTPDAAVDAPPIPAVAIFSNVNGPEVVGVDFPGTWAADPGSGGICNGTEGGQSGGAIQNTVDDELFATNMRADPLTCRLGSGNLPAGDYTVTLLFGETFQGGNCPGGGVGTGARVFDIDIEGVTVATGIDPFADGNGCVADPMDADATPFALTFDVTVDDGTATVELDATSGTAILSAMAVESR